MKHHAFVVLVLLASVSSGGIRRRPAIGPENAHGGFISFDCPCFSAESIAVAAAEAPPLPLLVACGASKTLTLAADGSPGPIATIGKWTQLDAGVTCEYRTTDPLTGDPVIVTRSVDTAQRASCQAILTVYCP